MPSHAATPLQPKEVKNSFEIKDLFGKKPDKLVQDKGFYLRF